MQTIDTIVYFRGLSAAMHFVVCLICGLQLCFDIFGIRRLFTKISRLTGVGLLMMAFCTLLFVLSDICERTASIGICGLSFQYLTYAVFACIGHLLYSNNQVKIRSLSILSAPFVLIAVMNLFLPSTRSVLYHLSIAYLIALNVFYAVALHRRERWLDDLYSDTDSHSLNWLWYLLALYALWVVLQIVFQVAGLEKWIDMLLYNYITLMVLFAFTKINNYAEPVSLETLVQIQEDDLEMKKVYPNVPDTLQMELDKLLKEQQIFLNPDLTIENVAVCLNTSARKLSVMIHNDMHTSFCQLINNCRIDRAKELLRSSSDKVEHIGLSCGFHSYQSFFRTFSKITGKTPSEWRNL